MEAGIGDNIPTVGNKKIAKPYANTPTVNKIV